MIKSSNICINKIVDCHLDAFPNSIYNEFGRKFLTKTFKWYVISQKKRKLLSFEENNISHGFLTMRRSDDGDSFVSYILKTFIIELIKNPRMIINRKFISKVMKKHTLTQPMVISNNLLTMELISIGVRFESRNKGIGKKLIEKFEEVSKASSCKELMLKVKKDNQTALKFYNSCDWFEVGAYSNFIILKKEI